MLTSVQLVPFLCWLLLLPLSFEVLGQNEKTTLENTAKQLEEEINYTAKLIDETNQSKKLTLSELQILLSKIAKRENLIATIQKQLLEIESKLQKTEHDFITLSDELKGLQKEYAKMILFAHRNKSGVNKLMFLFAAQDFNQAFQRMKYLQQYSAHRQTQMQSLQKTKDALYAQQLKLEKEKKLKAQLFESERREQIKLNNEKQKIDQTVQQLSQKESQLKKSLKQKEQEALKLQKAIEAIIAEEIRLANEREKQTKPTTNLSIRLTPEEMKLSDSFTKNKGKLPWPVERGVIASGFGVQPHPVLKKVSVKNNGIDIATTTQSEARAVFDGVVVSINRITATNNAVIVRHGEYFTVYSNLEQIHVKRGDAVVTKQTIGTIHTDKSESKTELHFELWKGKQLFDPAGWLVQ